MFLRYKERFGIAGVVLGIIALILALGGTAIAASGLSGKQKKEVTKIAQTEAKKYAGKTGPAGSQGTAGPQGPAGANGKDGAQGPKGDTGATGPQGNQGVQGPAGSPWTAGGTLPSDETETGTWGYERGESQESGAIAMISFPIPLNSALTEADVHLIGKNGEELVQSAPLTVEEKPPTKCGSALTPPGTVARPEAAPGNLCIYISHLDAEVEEARVGSNLIIDPSEECEFFGCLADFGGPGAGAGRSGALLEALAAEPGLAWGTWAVTAP